jgi:predicted transcriptional regulator
MKDNNFYTIQGWMVNQLNLQGNELLVYAIIYGFSQDGESEFNGSLKYLSEMTNSNKSTMSRTIEKLIDKGLIIRKKYEINNSIYYHYVVDLGGLQNATGVANNNGGVANCNGSYSNNSYSNTISIDNNIRDNIEKKDITKVISKESKRFSKPTIQEIQEYCAERKNGIDAEVFFDFYESKGWKVGTTPMKDWKACIRTWERKENKSFYKAKYKITDEMIDSMNVWGE